MNEPLLQHINSPDDVKKLNKAQLSQLCQELRQMMIETTSKNGANQGRYGRRQC